MGHALLFPGQGTLNESTLAWLDSEVTAAALLERMAAHVGPDWRARLADAEWRSRNRIAQPLVVGLSLAAAAVLHDALPPPDVVAGYSVGELSALSVAQVCPATAAIDLAVRRAALMDDAAAALGFEGGLMAVDLNQAGDFDALTQQFSVQVAIDQAAGRRVVGGPLMALGDAAAWVAERGGLARRLAVGLPSHTRWMSDAADAFALALASVPFAAPSCPVALNATGTGERQVEALRTALGAQIASTVQWQACMRTVAERGVACALEVGPGNALARLWQVAHPEIPVRSVADFRNAAGAIDWVLSQTG